MIKSKILIFIMFLCSFNCCVEGKFIETRYFSKKKNFSFAMPKAFAKNIEELPCGEMNSDVIRFTDYLGNSVKIEVVTLRSECLNTDQEQIADFLCDYFYKYVLYPFRKVNPRTNIVSEMTLETKNGRIAVLTLISLDKKGDVKEKSQATLGMLTFLEKNQVVTLTYTISNPAVQLLEIARKVSINDRITYELVNFQFGYRNETVP